jgi:hypothetical protein
MVVALGSVVFAGCSEGDDAAAKVNRLRAQNAALREQLQGKNLYQCTVLAYQELTDDGLLREGTIMRDQVVGASFVADKSTGLIAGGIGNNATFESRKVVFTPPGNPFYLISESGGPNRNVDLLLVRDWADGPDKPFLLIQSGIVSNGICQ